MPAIAFNRFYRYTAFTRLLKTLVEEHPNLLRLESIGKSHEGRDVWLVTATNFASGPDIEKPALWVDGNLHASEVAGSMAALYFINTLVTRYGKDAERHRRPGYARFLHRPTRQPRRGRMGAGR